MKTNTDGALVTSSATSAGGWSESSKPHTTHNVIQQEEPQKSTSGQDAQAKKGTVGAESNTKDTLMELCKLMKRSNANAALVGELVERISGLRGIKMRDEKREQDSVRRGVNYCDVSKSAA